MAETISSAIVQETVNRILSGLVQKYEEKYESDANKNLERLEMAHIRLEAALATSHKWHITNVSLLRWRKKLKRAAQECDDTLHKCKQRVQDDENIEQEVRNSSLPNRIVHATKSFFFSIFSGNNNELRRSTVQRFEWFAAGASEFVRFVELGGTPRHVALGSLIKNLSAGLELHLKIVHQNQYPMIELLLIPNNTAEHGIVASLIFIQKDGNGPKGTIYFRVILQLSETTDIVGIAIKCSNLFAPHLKSAVENIRKELTQLHTQNFFWVPSYDSCRREHRDNLFRLGSQWSVPSVYSCRKEHWDNLFSLGFQWFRPNPLCCMQNDRHKLRCMSSLDIAGFSLKPVIAVTFVTFMSNNDIISLQDAPYLKEGITFAPHGSLEGIVPANNGSALVDVQGEKQYCLDRDTTLEKLKEITLPKAIDYFSQNADATVYHMIWQSEHGSALIHFEKASMSTRRNCGGSRKRKLLQRQEQGLSGTLIISRFLDLWGAHMPIRLRSFFVDWMRKEKEGLITAQQGHSESCNREEIKNGSISVCEVHGTAREKQMKLIKE